MAIMVEVVLLVDDADDDNNNCNANKYDAGVIKMW